MANSADAKLGAGYANNFIKDFGLWFTWSWLLRQCWAVLVLAVLGMLSYSLISHFLFQSVQVDGQSMYPSLKNSGHYWLNRFAYVVSDPKPQEIVALKSPGDNTLVVMDEMAANPQFAQFNLIRISPEESYAANCVRVNDRVLVAKRFPQLTATLKARGFNPLILDMSEFQKMDGGLSCLSLRF